jgi:hypothetical protein
MCGHLMCIVGSTCRRRGGQVKERRCETSEECSQEVVGWFEWKRAYMYDEQLFYKHRVVREFGT